MSKRVERMVVASTHRAVKVMVAMLHLDPTVTAKALSAQVGLSLSRLTRLFKRQLGVSIVVYRNRLRFHRFFKLVAGGRTEQPTLRAAARAAGFRSYAQFHRLCRAHWHLEPRDAARAARRVGARQMRSIVERDVKKARS